MSKILDFFRKPPILMVAVVTTFIFVVLVISGELSKPAERGEGPAHKTKIVEEKKIEGKEEAEDSGKNEEEHPAPLLYFIQWILLLSTFGVGAFYAFRIFERGQPKHEGILLAYILTFAVFSIYGLGYTPVLKEYHEPGWASFIKFVLLILATAVVTFYGVLGRHDEYEEGEEESERRI